MSLTTGSPAWDAWFNSGMRKTRIPPRPKARKRTAQKLHEKLIRLGYDVLEPERQTVGRHQRACGAWVWFARPTNGYGLSVGSSWTMTDCVSMSDEEFHDNIELC